MLAKKRVLVIGGNGFLGSNIVWELKCQGHAVSVLDIKIPEHPLEDINYHCGSIRDLSLFSNIVQKQDCIIYLKSSTTPATSMADAAKAYCEDLPDIMATCQLCLQQGVRKIVFASSGGTVYGDLKLSRPYREDDATYPRNHYGIAKLASENILLMYNTLFGMENIVLRIANPYGCGQTIASGVGAITSFAEKIICGQKIQLCGDGNIVRDYIDVSDVAKAFTFAIGTKENCELPIFNIGSGKGFSLMQIIELLQKYLNKEATIDFLPNRIFDVNYNVLDISKAGKVLGYFPQCSPEEGIKEYVQKLKLVKE